MNTKPGDVVLVRKPDGTLVRGFCAGSYGGITSVVGVWTWHGDDDPEVARHLVVIDPEDREQTAAVAKALMGQHITTTIDIHAAVKRALRSLVTDPKPEEPQGKWAVVSCEGAEYLRDRYGKHPWLQVGTSNHVAWDEIDGGPITVHSEGVTE